MGGVVAVDGVVLFILSRGLYYFRSSRVGMFSSADKTSDDCSNQKRNFQSVFDVEIFL